jgi:hypothetical protein
LGQQGLSEDLRVGIAVTEYFIPDSALQQVGVLAVYSILTILLYPPELNLM